MGFFNRPARREILVSCRLFTLRQWLTAYSAMALERRNAWLPKTGPGETIQGSGSANSKGGLKAGLRCSGRAGLRPGVGSSTL